MSEGIIQENPQILIEVYILDNIQPASLEQTGQIEIFDATSLEK